MMSMDWLNLEILESSDLQTEIAALHESGV